MTQEQKELLLKDLCSRLLYDVKLSYRCNHIHILKSVLKSGMILITDTATNINTMTDVENVRPYLFPLSSMTEKQKKDYHNLCSIGIDECDDIVYFNTYESIDYLNKNKFDYRYLIPIGLAIDATDKNIYLM